MLTTIYQCRGLHEVGGDGTPWGRHRGRYESCRTCNVQAKVTVQPEGKLWTCGSVSCLAWPPEECRTLHTYNRIIGQWCTFTFMLCAMPSVLWGITNNQVIVNCVSKFVANKLASHYTLSWRVVRLTLVWSGGEAIVMGAGQCCGGGSGRRGW